MSELMIVEPEIQDLQVSSGDIVAHASMLVVKDDVTRRQGAEILMEIKKFSDVVKTRFKTPVELAFKAHRSMTALRDSVLNPFSDAERTIKRKIADYEMAIEQKRREEADKLRREAEAKAKAEQMAKAQEQMDKGDLAGCQKTLDAPIVTIVAKVETKEPEKISGLSFREDWKFEIEDESLIPREYLMVDEIKIRKLVKALQKSTNIPGIRVYADKTPIVKI